jgi:rod shape-determining protein MreC
MYSLRRWWEQNGGRTLFVGSLVGGALFIRQTQGAMVTEVYQALSRPFQGAPNKQETLVNTQMVELQQRLIELQGQNQQFEALLGFAQSTKVQGVPAPVIGRSGSQWWEQITLGRGSADGLAKDQIVMSPSSSPGQIAGSVVGQVKEVTAHTARVLLISDPGSQLGVTVSRSRATGYLRGQKNNRAVMEFFDKSPDVRKGDPIAVSNLSRKFPKGLPVGRIESVDLGKSPAPEATVELSAPLASLEWVVVFPTPPAVEETAQPAKPLSPQPSSSPDVVLPKP